MDEDFLKRNTDCVYFLASPLTCKKGAECEYRHHEIARLNPRDCWYWLSGNCLNPTCAFRHPPLDGHTGVPSEPVQSSVPASVNKTKIPCYFFFNGFCNKGHNCSFLHGPNDSLPAVKPLKNNNGSINAVNLKNKTSSGNKTFSASTPSETHLDKSVPAPKALPDIKLQPKEELQLPLPENVAQQVDCLEFSAFDYKETAVTQSESPVPDDDFTHNPSPSCTEQCSDEQENSHIEPEERWESSPGFDVLVHDESGSQGYENDSEYMAVLDTDDHELNGQFSAYEFKDTEEYNTMCSDAGVQYEQETWDDYRCFDTDFARANNEMEREVCGYSREIVLDTLFSRKRIRMSAAEMAACDSDFDLRNHLRRRREINGSPDTGLLRRHESSSLMVRYQERHQRQDLGQQQNRRLTSQVGFSSIREVEDISIANKQRLFRSSQQNRPRKHYREKEAKWPIHSSKVSKKPVVKQQRSIEESGTFSGPKTLAEIKEKKKADERSRCENSAAGFQNPKPLSELLKDRKTMD